MKHWFVPIYVLILLALWIIAWIGLILSSLSLVAIGLIISTSAPLAFFIGLYVFKRKRTEPHPVWVSMLSGLGAVMIMVVIYRYGDQHPIWMGGAITTLTGWMLYLKLFKLDVNPAEAQASQQNELD